VKIPENFTLKSKNFQLRIPDETDLEFVLSTSQYPQFHDGMLWEPPISIEELVKPLNDSIESWKEGNGYSFTIETKDNKPIRVGRISIRKTEVKDIWNVGFWVHPKYQKRGIMTEVLKVIIKFGFEKLNAKEITARYADWNKASEKVLINNNFKFVKHIERGFLKKGKWISENEFSLARGHIKEEKSNSTSKCEFCCILKDNPNTIFENDLIVVLLDIDPISLGHVIICPKNHYSDFHELPNNVMNEMMKLAKKYTKVLQDTFLINGYSMMLNAGKFNDLNHCHLHVFPRKSKKEFQWIYSEENIAEDAKRFDVLRKLLKGKL